MLAKTITGKRVGLKFGFVLALGYLAGCVSVYVPETPKWSDIPATTPQAFDGDWKTENGTINRFEKGKGRVLNAVKLDPFDIVFKNIQRVGPGKYSIETLTWNNSTRKSSFGTGYIELISPTELLLRTQPDPATSWGGHKLIMTNIRLDNELSFIKEIEDMRLVVKSPVLMNTRDYPMIFLTENEENTISQQKTVFADLKNVTVNVHMKPCTKAAWRVDFFFKNESKKLTVGPRYGVGAIHTEKRGTGSNCISKTSIQSTAFRDFPPGQHTATLVVEGAAKRSVDFTISP